MHGTAECNEAMRMQNANAKCKCDVERGEMNPTLPGNLPPEDDFQDEQVRS